MPQKTIVALVNDQPEYVQLIADFLSAEGYEVISILNHQSAFNQIQQNNPDIIVCDITFESEATGFALLDMIYLDPKTRETPLIVSAPATQHIQEVNPSLAARGITWIEKPFTIEDLISLLKKTEKKAVAS